MIASINKFEKILQTFKFKQPVPYNVQKLILKFKRETVINVLKHFGEYNIFYGSVLRFHFFTKRIGINITARQSEIICIIISFVTAALSLAGILVFAGFINFGNTASPVSLIKEIEINREEKNINKQVQDVPKEIILKEYKEFAAKSRIVMKKISSDDNNEELASGITDKLYYILKETHGSDRIIYRKFDGIRRSANRLLQGRLHKIGSTYLLSISIANAETGKIVYDRSYSFKKNEEIDEVLNQISESINNIKDLK